MSRINLRRNTTHSSKTPIEESSEENEDENEEDNYDSDPDMLRGSGRKNMSADHEDVLISIILKHFDIVENKSTNKSLTSDGLEAKQNAAWAEIRNEFADKTTVS